MIFCESDLLKIDTFIDEQLNFIIIIVTTPDFSSAPPKGTFHHVLSTLALTW